MAHKFVTFDISNESFDFYNEAEWTRQIHSWREEIDEWLEGVEVSELTEEEVVDYMYGGELFSEEFEV